MLKEAKGVDGKKKYAGARKEKIKRVCKLDRPVFKSLEVFSHCERNERGEVGCRKVPSRDQGPRTDGGYKRYDTTVSRRRK